MPVAVLKTLSVGRSSQTSHLRGPSVSYPTGGLSFSGIEFIPLKSLSLMGAESTWYRGRAGSSLFGRVRISPALPAIRAAGLHLFNIRK